MSVLIKIFEQFNRIPYPVLFTLLCERLPLLINSINELCAILAVLPTEMERLAAVETIKFKLPLLICHADQLICVLEYLPIHQRDSLLQGLLLDKIIDNFDNLCSVLPLLPKGACIDQLAPLWENFVLQIQSPDQLNIGLHYFPLDHQDNVLKIMRERWVDFTKNSFELAEFLAILTDENCTMVLKGLKDQLKEIIQNGEGLSRLLYEIKTLEQFNLIFTVRKDLFQLTEGCALGVMLNNFDITNFRLACCLMRDEWCEIIGTTKRFIDIMQAPVLHGFALSEVRRMELFTAVKAKLIMDVRQKLSEHSEIYDISGLWKVIQP